MANKWALDKQYAEIMQNHPFGIALYRPLSSSLFRPGACGYFDEFGSWNPIGNLAESGSIVDKGLSPVDEELEKAPLEDGIKWGPMTSTDTKATKVELSGGVDPATGIPITVSSVYAYSTDKDVGAILLTSPPITHERFYHASPFKTWVKHNAERIVQRWPEVRKHGLWIVTSTYATKRCAINMWKDNGKGFKVGFSVDAMGFGGAGTSGEWYRSRSDEGWGEYTAKEGDESVVFFGGLKFQYTWRLSGKGLGQSRPVLRGGPTEEIDIITTIPDSSNEEACFDIDCEEYLGDESESLESDEW